jgi:DNA-binding IclR family transcriptional regulator
VNWSAAGRILVSDLSPAELRRTLPALVRPSPSGKATTRIATLIRQIADARQRGIATQASQSLPIIGAVAARVDGPDGRCAAALCVLVPVHRMSGRWLQVLEDATIAAAVRLSAALAGSDEPGGRRVKPAPRQRTARRSSGSQAAAGSRRSSSR